MNSSDKKNLVIFILLIVAIVSILIFNVYKNRKFEVDRKVEYIFDKFTYDSVFNEGKEMFFQTIKILNNKNGLEYERNNYNHYKRITNFSLVTNVLKTSEINKFMDIKKIIKYENNYYIENYKEEYNKDYIGSILDIESYNDKYVYFKSVNYYCENSNYIGALENTPNCNYVTSNTKFTIILENNNLRVNDLEEIINILK